MKKTLTLIAAACMAAPSAFAGSATGFITGAYPLPSGITLFDISVTPTGRPSCSTFTSPFAIDATTAGGKVIAGWITMAYITGKSITITGTGTCSVVSNSETINDVHVVN